MLVAAPQCSPHGSFADTPWQDLSTARPSGRSVPVLNASVLTTVLQWQKLPGLRRQPSYPRTISINACCPPKMQRTGPWGVHQYKLLRQIGQGRASVVYHAICLTSHQSVAVKVYQKQKLSEVTRRQVEREVEIHSRMHHQHIIDLYGVFEDDDSLYMVEEFAARGDLLQEKKARGGHMTEHQVVRDVLQPFLSTLNFLHSQGIVHRDIKPENLLFTANGTLKVTDFGTAIDLRRERAVSRLGTLDYMAPEILRCPNKQHPADNKDNTEIHYNTRVDNWAVGVLAYELLVGRPPFEKESIEQTLQEIMQREPDMPAWLSEECQDFISQCLCKDAARRPTVLQLLKHRLIMVHGRRRSTVVYSQPPSPDKNLALGHQRAASNADCMPSYTGSEQEEAAEPPSPCMHSGWGRPAPAQLAATPARQCWQPSPSRMATPGGGRPSRFSAQPHIAARLHMPQPRVLYADIACSPRDTSQAGDLQNHNPLANSLEAAAPADVAAPCGRPTPFSSPSSPACGRSAACLSSASLDGFAASRTPASPAQQVPALMPIGRESGTSLPDLSQSVNASPSNLLQHLHACCSELSSPARSTSSPSPTQSHQECSRKSFSKERVATGQQPAEMEELVLQALQSNALAVRAHRSHSLPCTPRTRSPVKLNKSPSPTSRRACQARHMSLTGVASGKPQPGGSVRA